MLAAWQPRRNQEDAVGHVRDRDAPPYSRTASASWFIWSDPTSKRSKSWPTKTRCPWVR